MTTMFRPCNSTDYSPFDNNVGVSNIPKKWQFGKLTRVSIFSSGFDTILQSFTLFYNFSENSNFYLNFAVYVEPAGRIHAKMQHNRQQLRVGAEPPLDGASVVAAGATACLLRLQPHDPRRVRQMAGDAGHRDVRRESYTRLGHSLSSRHHLSGDEIAVQAAELYACISDCEKEQVENTNGHSVSN